jgi:hypothetical protein
MTVGRGLSAGDTIAFVKVFGLSLPLRYTPGRSRPRSDRGGITHARSTLRRYCSKMAANRGCHRLRTR